MRVRSYNREGIVDELVFSHPGALFLSGPTFKERLHVRSHLKRGAILVAEHHAARTRSAVRLLRVVLSNERRHPLRRIAWFRIVLQWRHLGFAAAHDVIAPTRTSRVIFYPTRASLYFARPVFQKIG